MRKMILLALFIAALFLTFSTGIAEETMRIDFLNVGKADAIIISKDPYTIVIDTGTNAQGKVLVRELQNRGCKSVDLLIITHYDKDHVGGADKLISSIPVKQILVPAYTSTSKQTTQFFDAVDEFRVPCEQLNENRTLMMDDMKLVIDIANERDYGEDEENDFSLVTSLFFGKCSFLFAGDAENPRLGELLSEEIGHHDVLKVPHHGQAEKLSAAFFEAVSPRHAVITSDTKELEDAAVVRFLESAGTQVWLTREGTVTCTCDGENIRFSQSRP